MGFQGRVLRLRWPEGHQLHGMEVDIRPGSVRALEELAEGAREGETEQETRHRRLNLLCSHVVRWNLEHHETGEPLARTAQDLDEFDGWAIVELLDAWTDNGRIPSPSKREDAVNGTEREPVDPLAGTSAPGLPMGASSEVEVSIPTQDAQ